MTSDKPRAMKVLISQDNGFRVQEISRPLLSEGEMLLQVTACGVCFSDVHDSFSTNGRPRRPGS